MNGNRGHYAYAPLNNMKNKRAVQAAVPAARTAADPQQEEQVRRSGVMSIAVTLVLPVLFILALMIDSVALRLIFLAVAAIAIAAMWLMNVFARGARSTLSIAYAALMVVIAVALALSLQTPESQQNSNAVSARNTQVQDWTAPYYASTATSASATPSAYIIEETTTSAAQKQLESFILGWRENAIPTMLPMCAPSWVAKQQSPEAALWNLMRNREPVEYRIENVQGSEADTSRTITVKVTFENQGTGDVTVERMNVMMLRVNETWYVDPQSLNGTVVDEAAEQARAERDSQRIQSTKAPVTATPEPTGDDAVQVFYNPDGGRYYHKKASCPDVAESYWPLTPLYYSDLETQNFLHLMQCPTCDPPARRR